MMWPSYRACHRPFGYRMRRRLARLLTNAADRLNDDSEVTAADAEPPVRLHPDWSPLIDGDKW